MVRLPGLVVLLLLVAGLAPAQAEPEQTPRTVTVRAACVGGGTVVLRHTTEAGSTHVEVRARGLRNGTWYGSHLLEVGVDDTEDTEFATPVRHHRASFDFDVEDTGKAGVLDLNQGKRRCFASFDENRPFVIMGSATLSVLARRTDSGLLVRSEVQRCRPGTSWTLDLAVGFDGGGAGAGRPADCGRHGWLRTRWDLGLDPRPTARPQDLAFTARGEGSRERLSYHATRPPVG